MDEKFLHPYNAKATEEKIYTAWEQSGFFNPDNLPGERSEYFSIVLPPPNVTGVLHIGHAFEDTLQDVLVRFNRMRGKRTLWIPGTDSAAIATQARVEKEVYKTEGKSRHDLGRDELVRRVETYAKNSENTILSQVRKMGASLDWSRYAYTLDEARTRAVFTAFVRMYEAGLIYRGHRIVNWDPKGQTTISDDEIVYVEEKTTFYEFTYGPFTIGTSRPETKFGDKYVVMHPKDERYAQYTHGQKIELEWINGPITATIIKDEAVDMEFGTGVMTITPWHDVTDFDIASRHELDREQIIDSYGKLLPIAGEFSGMKITDARQKIVEKLRSKGLVASEKDYVHNIATAERTGGVIEPQIMLQWFVNVNHSFTIPHSTIPGVPSGSQTTLKQLMYTAVESDAVTMFPERFRKSYFHWIENLHDWCISRQIWFGHRIPVWYRGEEVFVGLGRPSGEGWTQDPDVLDTWFSSALWTFSTLGWPDSSPDLRKFHPTSFILPGYEILYLWVSRMILMSSFLTGDVPFKTVMLHGIVRDKQGRKFSKSLGNAPDPLDIIEKFGTDALRMGLVVGAAPGNDVTFDESKIKGYKNFANKIWNVARFVYEQSDLADASQATSYTEEDLKDLEELDATVREVTRHLEDYRVDLAADRAYHYVWHTFADQVLEKSKLVLKGDDPAQKHTTSIKLHTMLATSLKLLHPFMPFVTEEIWQHMKEGPWKHEHLLMIEPWPN
jgi:valyl-tRNA synthetase